MNIFELKTQIEMVEGIKLGIKITQELLDKDFNPYPYTTPMSGDKTIDDFKAERLYPALLNFKEN